MGTRVSGRKLPVAIDTPLGRLDSSHRTNLVSATSLEPVTKSFYSTDTEIGKLKLNDCDNRMRSREYLLKYDLSEHQTIYNQVIFGDTVLPWNHQLIAFAFPKLPKTSLLN